MEQSNKLTDDQLQSLSLYLDCFKTTYRIATGKKLEEISQIIDVILDGTFTFEDVFMVYIDSVFLHEDNTIGYTWDDHMELYDYQNFFPNSNGKKIDNGAWIKFRSKNGYELHFAKPSRRKRRFNEEIEACYRKTAALLKKGTRDLESVGRTESDHDDKLAKLEEQLNILKVYQVINIKPYEVVIKRTKYKSEYYMPHQYEIVDDLDEHIKYAIGKVPGVDVKAMRDGDNEDKVFYLRSRGISEGMARIMASLNQTYFTVNMDTVFEKYNEQFSRVKLVTA